MLWSVSAFDCSKLVINDKHYDLTLLKTEEISQISVQTIDTPPTVDNITVSLQVCQPFNGIEDGCPIGSYGCLITTNWKQNVPRVTRIQPISQNQPTVDGKDTLLLKYQGNHTVTLELECAKEDLKPNLVKHTAEETQFKWQTKSACTSDKTQEPVSTSSPVSWTWLILRILLVYLVLGMLYNYHVGQKSFPEIIPNYSFWQFVYQQIVTGYQYVMSKFDSQGQYVRL
ncbi:hypothetical protein EDD86DRAFT_249680 [Gorgonomyces haynaldii]|nr:hypothetical protein EDD86DRAFT_249680 [Gorgonomyces haynaldii]